MSAVRSRITSRRTLMPLLLAVCAVLLIVAALAFAPSSRDSSRQVETTTTPRTTETTIGDDSRPMTEDGKVGNGIVAPSASDFDAGRSTGGAASVAADGESIAEPVAQGSTLTAPALDARIIRTATVQLTAKRSTFESAWGDAQATARTYGGIVTASSRSGSADRARSATITLRVPSGKFDAAVASLRDIEGVKVAGLDVASEDASEEYVDTTSRLKHDRAVEARLLTLLAATKTVNEVLAVQARLDAVQEQIEVSAGRLRYLDQMTSMSTIDVTIRQPSPNDTTDSEDEPSVVGDALDDAQERFLDRISGVIVWFGGALPALVVLAFLLLLGRFLLRRRSQRPTHGEGSAQPR